MGVRRNDDQRRVVMKSLSQTEIANAQAIIDSKAPGDYELKVLYGDAWSQIDSPTTFGKRFKMAVENGSLKRITKKEVRTDNHHVYSIDASA